MINVLIIYLCFQLFSHRPLLWTQREFSDLAKSKIYWILAGCLTGTFVDLQTGYQQMISVSLQKVHGHQWKKYDALVQFNSSRALALLHPKNLNAWETIESCCLKCFPEATETYVGVINLKGKQETLIYQYPISYILTYCRSYFLWEITFFKEHCW